jgi:tetrahydrodipicolinate N-succinyltransferase
MENRRWMSDEFIRNTLVRVACVHIGKNSKISTGSVVENEMLDKKTKPTA